MGTVEQTIDALGDPVALTPERHGQLLLGRWRHGDARIDTSGADVLRVLLTLDHAQQVHYADPEHDAAMVAGPGDVGVLPAGVPTTVTVDGDADIVQVFIDAAAVDPEHGADGLRRSLLGADSERLRAAAVQLFVREEQGEALPARAAADALRGVVADLMRAGDPSRAGDPGLPATTLRRLDGLIRAAPGSRGPSVPQLADEAGLSVRQLLRAFRRATGTTPHQQVLNRRLQRALGLLADPEPGLTEVALDAGFSSHAHFTAAFRDRFGVTPRDYRGALQSSGR